MSSTIFRLAAITAGTAMVALAAAPEPGRAGTANPYPAMAPLQEYLMPRDAEIALARSAGPESVTRDAEVLVLTAQGYETAIPGHNGYVCVVERNWQSPSNAPEFWNPHGRGPICWNPAGAHYCVPLLRMRTALALAGKTKEEIAAAMKASFQAGEFPALGAGAMCFMMSKDGHLNDAVGHWHPHLMFYQPVAQASDWGANLPGSPVISTVDDLDNVTIFMVPIRSWSDGSIDVAHEGSH